jgi:hypothetical protein
MFSLLILSWHLASAQTENYFLYGDDSLLGVKSQNGKIIISPNRHGIQEPTGIIGKIGNL